MKWRSSPRLPFTACFAAVVLLSGCFVTHPYAQAQTSKQLKLSLTVGHRSARSMPFYIHAVASGGASIKGESDWKVVAGAGHVETRTFTIEYADRDIVPIQDMHVLWQDLIVHSDEDTARRLLQDPALRVDSRRVRIELNAEGTSGFTVTLDQLLSQKTFWVPSLDVFIATGDNPVSFEDDQAKLKNYAGKRVLDEVRANPEASYAAFNQKWEDMGSPAYIHPAQEGPGHIVCLSWDSTIPKFGIDRGAGVWSDEGNPDRFRFWYTFSNLAEGIVPYWKGQSLADGLPVMTTVLERDHVRYEIEQFAYPLSGPPSERVGNINMVLLQRVRLTDLTGTAHVIPVSMVAQRRLQPQSNNDVMAETFAGQTLFVEAAHHNAILAVDAGSDAVNWSGVTEIGRGMKSMSVAISVPLPANGTSDIYVTLPSPTIDQSGREALKNLNYETARANTLKFWSAYVDQGARFEVPEKAVNDLFRASLWHALRLPRLYPNGQMDLPYADFAYSQKGTPWPINQAVYVDYMLYGLRGYNDIAQKEIEAIYRNNQEFDGRLDGEAQWMSYTPGMLYAVAQNYLLSGDRDSFEKTLPQTLQALDWSIAQVRNAAAISGPMKGIVQGPLNDLTHGGEWAFNQAYFYAGIKAMGEALAKAGNPRAAECKKIAEEYRPFVEHAMSVAMVQSPLVQLRDHTWIPYVPSEAEHPGRNYVQWYPSDVDTGAAHLLRLQALPAQGQLADSILNDNEDNLFLHGWGSANEPVYAQQALAYLLRDDAKATIWTFYSLMSSGFSHSVYEPVEHRWRWGQYFGPPSTDGAWVEIYRNMLVREENATTLILAQATPRDWLQDGKSIRVTHAPTWFGDLSMQIQSHAAAGNIQASFQLNVREQGKTILFRLRHPEGKTLRAVKLNGKPWMDFDPKKEWIRIPNVGSQPYTIFAEY